MTADPPITIYTTPSCRPCKRVIGQLEKSGLEFQVVDLSLPEHADAKTYVTEVLGARSTPVVVSDVHDPIIGYEPLKLKALITAVSLGSSLTLNGEE